MTEEEIFNAVLELPVGASQDAFLDEVCGGDSDLRGRVNALLSSHFRTGDFLDVPAVEQIQAGQLQTSEHPMHKGSGDASRNNDISSLSFLTPSTRPDSLGCLAQYEVLQVIGQGGFGIVLRAFDDRLQRVVAIKVLAPHLAVTSPARKRFLREARASAAARHENVVQVYEVGEQPLPYLVMEYIPGETLQQYLDRTGPLDVAQSIKIARQIAEGLAAAHAGGLIHRDIKPSNILLEAGQRLVKITDFGLARAADDASLTQSGMIAGTPLYMAPEQAFGKTLDHRADLFSLGSVFYQLVTGRPPFRANSTMGVIKRVAEDTPRPIREIIPETPQWLCDIIAKLHAKDPERRYQTAREVVDVLASSEARLQNRFDREDEPVAVPQAMAQRALGWRVWLTVPLFLAMIAAVFVYGPRLFRTADVQNVAAVPKVDQVAVVRAELKQRNPNYTGALHPTFDGDRVIGLEMDGQELRDLSPLRAFRYLQSLAISNAPLTDLKPLIGLPLTHLNLNVYELRDLSPLHGMPLESLCVRGWAGSDLKALEGMPLKVLNCSGQGQPIDLTPLSGLPLEYLYCNTLEFTNLDALQKLPLQILQCAESNVEDLSPLRGLALTHLNINNTRVRDLSPLLGMPLSSLDCQGLVLTELQSLVELPLVEIYCDLEFEGEAQLLRKIRTLKRINEKPAARVLKSIR